MTAPYPGGGGAGRKPGRAGSPASASPGATGLWQASRCAPGPDRGPAGAPATPAAPATPTASAGSSGASGGISSQQAASAQAHRGANGQPGGSRPASGGAPAMGVSGRPTSATRGIERSSPTV